MLDTGNRSRTFDPETCQNVDGAFDYQCFMEQQEGGKFRGVVLPPGNGAKAGWSVEAPLGKTSAPKSATVLPPGQGSLANVWSYEAPMTDAPTTGSTTPLAAGGGSFSGGGGSFGGGGATGSY